MILYLSTIAVAMILISTLNICFYPLTPDIHWASIIVITIVAVIFEIMIDGIFAGLIHSVPDKYMLPEKKFFCVGKRERRLYDFLKIKSWKDKVWELGALGGFRKNKLQDPNDPKYLYTFLIECNKGFVVHIFGCVFGFAIMLLVPRQFALTIGLPIAIVNVMLNCLSIMVLRYNTPKLKAGYERASRLAERNAKATLDTKSTPKSSNKDEK